MPKKIWVDLVAPAWVLSGLLLLAKEFGVAPFAEASWWVCTAPALLLLGLPLLVVGVVLSAIACLIIATMFLTGLAAAINAVRR